MPSSVVITGMPVCSAKRSGPRLGVAENDAVSGHDQRPLGLGDEVRGVGERPGSGTRARAGLPAPPRGARTQCCWFCTSFGHVDEHGAGPPLPRHREGLCARRRPGLVMSSTSTLYLVIGSVMPMMSVSWNASRPIIGRDTWPVIATTGELSMCAVASPVTRLVAPGPDVATHTPAARGAGVAVGGMGRRLFVPHQDVPQLRELGQRVVERHDRAARIPEHHVHALLQQDAAEELGAGEHLGHGHTPQ